MKKTNDHPNPYTLNIYDSYHITFERFPCVESAERKYKSMTVNPAFLVTIESSKLKESIVLQQPTTKGAKHA